MSLNLIGTQDAIITKLKELPQAVYETVGPEDSKLVFDTNGMLLPYIVVEFADMYDSPNAGGIVSDRYDLKESYIICLCIGPTERSARQIAGLVRDKLTGFTPTNAGELKLAGGGQSYTRQDTKPNRFITEVAFTFSVNTVW